jgi:hypothetical protein
MEVLGLFKLSLLCWLNKQLVAWIETSSTIIHYTTFLRTLLEFMTNTYLQAFIHYELSLFKLK